MCPTLIRKAHPSDVSDEEWSLIAPYITLMTEAAPQREYPMRELLNALRYVVRYGIAWRAMPNDLPPWSAVYQQTQRWLAAGCFDTLAHDLRAVLRLAAGRNEEPSAAIIDSRTLRSTPESGPRAGYDGAKRKRGSKVHMAVDTLGHLLALHVTPADVGDRTASSPSGPPCFNPSPWISAAKPARLAPKRQETPGRPRLMFGRHTALAPLSLATAAQAGRPPPCAKTAA